MGEWRGGYFCLKVHSQSGICERCLYSGLGNHPFCPGIPRFLEENGLRVQQFTLKVIVVTYKTFKLIVGFFETLSKNAQNPGKSRKNSSFNLYLRVIKVKLEVEKKLLLRLNLVRYPKIAPKNRWKRLFDLVALSTWSPRSAA